MGGMMLESGRRDELERSVGPGWAGQAPANAPISRASSFAIRFA